jgi:hypothetical protein
VKRGGVSVSEPELLKDEHGSVWVSSIQTYGDTVHTFVENVDYTGPFLPGFRTITEVDPLSVITPPVNLQFIDHSVYPLLVSCLFLLIFSLLFFSVVYPLSSTLVFLFLLPPFLLRSCSCWQPAGREDDACCGVLREGVGIPSFLGLYFLCEVWVGVGVFFFFFNT